jgi:hypothetical protein
MYFYDKKSKTVRISVTLEGIDSSDIRVGNNCMDVDTGLRILIIDISYLLDGEIRCLKLEYNGKDINILLL